MDILMISCITLLIFILSFASGNSSMRLTMVRKDSLFPKHLSPLEKEWRMFHISQNRSHYINSLAILSNNNTTHRVGPHDSIRPTVAPFASSIYAVYVGIGSQPYKTYLDMDTGSDFSWTQCKQCDSCFNIKQGRFFPERSDTYAPMAWDDPLCQPPSFERRGYFCFFRIRYVDADGVGRVAKETFTFGSDTGGSLSISNLVIGCATATSFSVGDNDGKDNVISGIFGMAPGPTAFLELAKPTVGSRFSYCLPRWNAPKGAVTFLRFGNDIPALPRGCRSTPMGTDRYYLKLQDITVFNTRLGLDPGLFLRRPDGRGGLAIDSGSGVTHLVRDAYEAVKVIITRYLFSFGLRPIDTASQNIPYDLCYLLSHSLTNDIEYRGMTYHFEGADLDLDFWRIFKVFEGGFLCMMIVPTDAEGTNLLGSFQQADYRFIYDLEDRRLYFFTEQCGGA